MISDKPDFRKVYKKANEIILSSDSINSFPFSAKDFVKEFGGIQCRTYKKAKEKYGVEMIFFGSASAVFFEINGRFMICYDESKSEAHKRFSIIHELGHVVNNHSTHCNSTLYAKQEVETNFFTAQILMPEQIINEFIRRGKQITVDFLVETFGVSKLAAQKRLETLRKIDQMRRNEEECIFDDIILKRFESFIDNVAPKGKELDWFEKYFDEEEERNSWR